MNLTFDIVVTLNDVGDWVGNVYFGEYRLFLVRSDIYTHQDEEDFTEYVEEILATRLTRVLDVSDE